MKKFYDTCALLNILQEAFKEHFFISNITFKEIENIKTSIHKDSEIKCKARRLIQLLENNEDKYTVVAYLPDWDKKLKECPILSDNNDSRILLTALIVSEKEPIIFISDDICCRRFAKYLKLDTCSTKIFIPIEYTGFKEITYSTDEELADIYKNINENPSSFNLLINQYLILKDTKGKIIDKYKYTQAKKFERILKKKIKSKMFGEVSPKDEYQELVIDSLENNQITMIRGAAGTGKSYLSFAYLFKLLEKGQIDKIIIFCNTVATLGSAKLGYYPGSRDEKLLDSQIGNLLSSKLGDKMMVTDLIEHNKIILLPMSDIRGYDTSGMHAGVYISEAQNLDIELMRLALQRIGEDSICILDGDSDAQVDLSIYSGSNNGMKRVSEIFRNHDFYGEITLQNIHRSKIAELAQLM